MPLLVLSLLFVGAAYLYASSQSWPPSQEVQAGLAAQMVANYQTATGQPMDAQMQAELALALADAPAHYVAQLPAGTTPTVSGYQAWALAKSNVAMGLVAPLTQAAQGAETATAQGPLGAMGGNPYPTWDPRGNAWFSDSHGRPYLVWNARDNRGDFPPPNWVPWAVRADIKIR